MEKNLNIVYRLLIQEYKPVTKLDETLQNILRDLV